jgi:hypothetical protein
MSRAAAWAIVLFVVLAHVAFLIVSIWVRFVIL